MWLHRADLKACCKPVDEKVSREINKSLSMLSGVYIFYCVCIEVAVYNFA